MPWNGTNGFAFTQTSIVANAPASSGVYALFNDGKWIYVGEGVDIQARLLTHLRDSHNECVNRANPAFFAYELVGSQTRVARQDQLILDLKPSCNKRLG
jgi:excinuclease UvrABC nuclease subunit